MQPTKILLIEDDEAIASELAEFLGRHGMETVWFKSYENIEKNVADAKADLLLLDQFVDGRDALTLLPEIRSGYEGGIVFLTGNEEAVDRIVALESGADDFVMKSLGPRELLARLRAVLRRTREDEDAHSGNDHRVSSDPGAVGNWSIDLNRQEVLAPDGVALQLTYTEFQLLTYLIRHASRVVTRDEVSREVLHRDFTPADRAVDNLVSRIRTAVEPHANGDSVIRSVRGQGYIFIGQHVPLDGDPGVLRPHS